MYFTIFLSSNPAQNLFLCAVPMLLLLSFFQKIQQRVSGNLIITPRRGRSWPTGLVHPFSNSSPLSALLDNFPTIILCFDITYYKQILLSPSLYTIYFPLFFGHCIFSFPFSNVYYKINFPISIKQTKMDSCIEHTSF